MLCKCIVLYYAYIELLFTPHTRYIKRCTTPRPCKYTCDRDAISIASSEIFNAEKFEIYCFGRCCQRSDLIRWAIHAIEEK